MKLSTLSEQVFACYARSCAPPPVGKGGSMKGGRKGTARAALLAKHAANRAKKRGGVNDAAKARLSKYDLDGDGRSGGKQAADRRAARAKKAAAPKTSTKSQTVAKTAKKSKGPTVREMAKKRFEERMKAGK